MDKPLEIGDHVMFVDPVAKPHNALVTAVWGPTCINVVLMNDDPNSQDVYGRQVERKTSVSHKSLTPAHGNYWMLPGEEQNTPQAPLAK